MQYISVAIKRSHVESNIQLFINKKFNKILYLHQFRQKNQWYYFQNLLQFFTEKKYLMRRFSIS